MKELIVCGSGGRMGNRLIHLIQADPETHLAGAVESPTYAKLGIDIGSIVGLEPVGMPVLTFDQTTGLADAVIDFSHPSGAAAAIDYCLAKRTPLVMATTGLDEETVNRLKTAAEQIPIVWAPNMSLAVNLVMKLTDITAKALKGEQADVEIIERHHRFKADAPSGTALKFGEIVALNMGQTEHRHGREGIVGQRPNNEIGYHAVRAGDNPGEHTIVFALMGETIELRVAASNRDCYASGAIAAAKFAADKPAGLYSMLDVLGLADA